MNEQMCGNEHELEPVVNLAELRQQWSQVKTAIREMVHLYNSSGILGDDRLDEICEYFEMKIEFDSPLAGDD